MPDQKIQFLPNGYVANLIKAKYNYCVRRRLNSWRNNRFGYGRVDQIPLAFIADDRPPHAFIAL
jgi:hypothetical protein